MKNFLKVKNFLLDLECDIVNESKEEKLFIIEDEDSGIKNLVIACVEPILILEQFLFEVKEDNMQMYKELLIKNRDIIHGAFVLDKEGKNMFFRDTLQMENLDLNELQGTINSLSLLMGEYHSKIIKFSNFS